MPDPPAASAETNSGRYLFSVDKVSRIFLLSLILVIGIVLIQMLKIFLIPIFLAAVFVSLIFPWYEKILAFTKGRKNLSAALACLSLLLILSIPVYIVVNLVRGEVVSMYSHNEATVQNIISQIDANLLDKINNSEFAQKLGIDLSDVDLFKSLQATMKGIGSLLLQLINKTWTGTFQFVMQVFIMFFTMYYFFRDGKNLGTRLKYLSPLNDRHEDLLMSRFTSMSRATVKGTVIIGLVQATLGGLLLWAFHFPSPLIAGVIMFFLSIIPMIGTWLLLYPIGIYMMIAGQLWQGLFIVIFTAMVIGNVDNILRPRLVGRDTGMHDLLIFFTTIGGMSVFGIMGFIVGPVIAALFVTLLEIYVMEFKPILDEASGIATEPAPPESADQQNS